MRLPEVLKDAWDDALPFSTTYGWRFYPKRPPAWYRRLVDGLALLRRIPVRVETLKALATERNGGDDYDTWYYRLKAALLLWGPVVWEYPYYAGHKNCGEVLGWDLRTWNGGEMTCWDATFVAVPHGWRLGRAHLYREGGP